MSVEFTEKYRLLLNELRTDSQSQVHKLTKLADDHKQFAEDIVGIIEDQIKEVAICRKLPIMYLIDCIIKNVSQYRQLFAQCIVQIFYEVFVEVDEKTRASLFTMRQTWSDFLPNEQLYLLDRKVQLIDPAWPVTAKAAQGKEDMSPQFSSKQTAVVQKDVYKEELQAKEQELEELRLRLELAEKQAKLEQQRRQPSTNSRTSSQMDCASPPNSLNTAAAKVAEAKKRGTLPMDDVMTAEDPSMQPIKEQSPVKKSSELGGYQKNVEPVKNLIWTGSPAKKKSHSPPRNEKEGQESIDKNRRDGKEAESKDNRHAKDKGKRNSRELETKETSSGTSIDKYFDRERESRGKRSKDKKVVKDSNKRSKRESGGNKINFGRLKGSRLKGKQYLYKQRKTKDKYFARKRTSGERRSKDKKDSSNSGKEEPKRNEKKSCDMKRKGSETESKISEGRPFKIPRITQRINVTADGDSSAQKRGNLSPSVYIMKSPLQHCWSQYKESHSDYFAQDVKRSHLRDAQMESLGMEVQDIDLQASVAAKDRSRDLLASDSSIPVLEDFSPENIEEIFKKAEKMLQEGKISHTDHQNVLRLLGQLYDSQRKSSLKNKYPVQSLGLRDPRLKGISHSDNTHRGALCNESVERQPGRIASVHSDVRVGRIDDMSVPHSQDAANIADPMADPRWAPMRELLDNDDTEELVVDGKPFVLRMGTSRELRIHGSVVDVSVDLKERGIRINNQLVYKLGEPIKEVPAADRTVRLHYHGLPKPIWLDGQQHEIRLDAPPRNVTIDGDRRGFQIVGRDMMILVDRLEKGPYGGPPRKIRIGGKDHDITFQAPPRRILIDGKSCSIKLDTKIPYVIVNGKPHGIRFDGEPRTIFINDQVFIIPVDRAEKIKIGQRPTYIALGGPAHEIIIDGKWFEVKFDNCAKDVYLGNRHFLIRLPGPVPRVKILEELSSLDVNKPQLMMNSRRNKLPLHFSDCQAPLQHNVTSTAVPSGVMLRPDVHVADDIAPLSVPGGSRPMNMPASARPPGVPDDSRASNMSNSGRFPVASDNSRLPCTTGVRPSSETYDGRSLKVSGNVRPPSKLDDLRSPKRSSKVSRNVRLLDEQNDLKTPKVSGNLRHLGNGSSKVSGNMRHPGKAYDLSSPKVSSNMRHPGKVNDIKTSKVSGNLRHLGKGSSKVSGNMRHPGKAYDLGSQKVSGNMRHSGKVNDLKSPKVSGNLRHLGKGSSKVSGNVRHPGKAYDLISPKVSGNMRHSGKVNDLKTPKVSGITRHPSKEDDLKSPKVSGHERLLGEPDDLESPKVSGNMKHPGEADDLKTPKVSGNMRHSGEADDLKSPKVSGNMKHSGEADDLKSPKVSGNMKHPDAADHLKSPKVSGNMKHPDEADDLKSPKVSGNMTHPDEADDLKSPKVSGNMKHPDEADDLKSPKVSGNMKHPDEADDLKSPKVSDNVRPSGEPGDLKSPKISDNMRHPGEPDSLSSPKVYGNVSPPGDPDDLKTSKVSSNVEHPGEPHDLSSPKVSSIERPPDDPSSPKVPVIVSAPDVTEASSMSIAIQGSSQSPGQIEAASPHNQSEAPTATPANLSTTTGTVPAVSSQPSVPQVFTSGGLDAATLPAQAAPRAPASTSTSVPGNGEKVLQGADYTPAVVGAMQETVLSSLQKVASSDQTKTEASTSQTPGPSAHLNINQAETSSGPALLSSGTSTFLPREALPTIKLTDTTGTMTFTIELTDLLSKLGVGLAKEPVEQEPSIANPAAPAIASGSRETEVLVKAKPEVEKKKARMPDFTTFRISTLKRHNKAVVDELHKAVQCPACAARFMVRDHRKYRAHRDWHFQQQKMETVTEDRKWFYSIPEWTLLELEDTDGKPESEIFKQIKSNEDGAVTGVAHSWKGKEFFKNPVATGTEGEDICAICGDPFDQMYDDDTQELMFKNTIKVEGKMYHPLCYETTLLQSSDQAEDAEYAHAFGTRPCYRRSCKTCHFILRSSELKAPLKTLKIEESFTCASSFLIYAVICTRTQCGLIYVGKTVQTLFERFGVHRRDVEKKSKDNVSRHFNLPDHKGIHDMKILCVRSCSGSEDDLDNLEMSTADELGTWAPHGLNIRRDKCKPKKK